MLLMLGPTKTMNSRRVNVPAKRSTWVAESAAGILNGDRTHIPVTCYMLLSALHFADSSICHSLCLARRRRGGTGPQSIQFWARNLAHDDDLLQSVKVWYEHVPSQSVCVCVCAAYARARGWVCVCTP